MMRSISARGWSTKRGVEGQGSAKWEYRLSETKSILLLSRARGLLSVTLFLLD
jgi:hypothetical protein